MVDERNCVVHTLSSNLSESYPENEGAIRAIAGVDDAWHFFGLSTRKVLPTGGEKQTYTQLLCKEREEESTRALLVTCKAYRPAPMRSFSCRKLQESVGTCHQVPATKSLRMFLVDTHEYEDATEPMRDVDPAFVKAVKTLEARCKVPRPRGARW